MNANQLLTRAVLCLAASTLGLLASDKAKLIPFDVPGSGTNPGQGTVAIIINDAGAVTGYYVDERNVGHGFLRAPDGHVTIIDAPGAGRKAEPGCNFGGGVTGYPAAQGTYAVSINLVGAIAGWYGDDHCVAHGFLRARDGTFTTIDAPNAGKGPGQGTFLVNINLWGETSGNIIDANGVNHTFLRAPNGTITTVDVPGAGTGPGQGTTQGFPCLSVTGAITGTYLDSHNVPHGYVRNPFGRITTFDAPGAGTESGQGTWAWSINLAETVVAYYVDSSDGVHGYMRSARGAYTAIDAPSPAVITIPESNNDLGAIVGNYLDASFVNHGFVRAPDGKFTTFDAPGAGTAGGQGTVPITINLVGSVTGFFSDGNNVFHGFVRTR